MTHVAPRRRPAAVTMLAGALASGLLATPTPALADDPAASCADAANAAQPLRRTGHLRAAREQLLRCANEACPEAIRGRCTTWLAEVDAALPSVVFRARTASGVDVVGLKVAIDDVPVTSPAGVATVVDPGSHRIRYEAPAIAVLREEEIVVAQGEKNRVVLVVFPDPVAAKASEPAAAPAAAPAARAPVVAPAIAYGTGALGLAALGAFAFLELKAHHDHDELEDGCAKTLTCDPDDLDAVRRTGAIAVVTGGIGVAAVGTSLLLLLWRRDAPAAARASGVTFRPTASGVAGSF